MISHLIISFLRLGPMALSHNNVMMRLELEDKVIDGMGSHYETGCIELLQN